MFDEKKGPNKLGEKITRRGFFGKVKEGAELAAATVIIPKIESAIGPIEAERKEYIERTAVLLEDPSFSKAERLPTTAEKEDNPGEIQVHKLETENGKLFKIEIPFSTLLDETKENKEELPSRGIANAVWVTYTRKYPSYQFSLGGQNPQDTEKLVRACQIFSGEEKEGLVFYLPEGKNEEFISKKYDNVIYPNDPHAGEPITALNISLMQITPVISQHHDESTGKYKFVTQNVAKPMAEYSVRLDSLPFENARQK